ncbi:MAG: phosphotransferase [Nocardioides sp.]
MTDPGAGSVTPYASLSNDDQLAVLAGVARAALPHFGVESAALELVLHGFNTTYRVDTVDGRRFAVRVNTNSVATAEMIEGQAAWTRALAADTELAVPEPLLAQVGAHSGSAVVPIEAPEHGRTFLVTVNSWLDGPDIGEHVTAEQARALGRATAILHRHASNWDTDQLVGWPVFDTPLLGDEVVLPLSGSAEADVHAEAMACTQAAFDRVYGPGERGAALIPLHADLHGDNLKWRPDRDVDRLAVFDFDDSGLGLPVLDLAISAYYLRRPHRAESSAPDVDLEGHLLAGYAEVSPLPSIDPADFEALVASRQLLLTNVVLGSSTAEWREWAASYLATSTRRLQRWLATGHFTFAADD